MWLRSMDGPSGAGVLSGRMLGVVVLFTPVLLRVVIVTAVVYLLLPQGPLCPHCHVDMVAIKNRFFHHLMPRLERRWCLECGWNGVVRRVRTARAGRSARRSAPRPTLHGSRVQRCDH